MKYFKDIDLQAAYELLNAIVHKITNTADVDNTVVAEGQLAFDQEARKLVVHDGTGVQQVAYISDIRATGAQVFYMTTDPMSAIPALPVNDYDMWFNPNDFRLKIWTGSVWNTMNDGDPSNILLPDARINETIPSRGISVHPTNLGVYQNRTAGDLIISGAGQSGSTPSHSEMISSGFTLITGTTSAVTVVLDYNLVGNSTGEGHWGRHPDYFGDANYGRYKFIPDTRDTSVFVMVDVQRNGTTPTAPDALKFTVRHTLPAPILTANVWTGAYDKADEDPPKRKQVYVDVENDDKSETMTVTFNKHTTEPFLLTIKSAFS